MSTPMELLPSPVRRAVSTSNVVPEVTVSFKTSRCALAKVAAVLPGTADLAHDVKQGHNDAVVKACDTVRSPSTSSCTFWVFALGTASLVAVSSTQPSNLQTLSHTTAISATPPLGEISVRRAVANVPGQEL